MDPVDAPARLLESDEDADASTPIARVAGEDTLPLYTLYGTSSIFVRVDDTQDDTQEESGKGHSQSGEQLEDQREDQRDRGKEGERVRDGRVGG